MFSSVSDNLATRYNLADTLHDLRRVSTHLEDLQRGNIRIWIYVNDDSVPRHRIVHLCKQQNLLVWLTRFH